ncbi:MAG: STAS domain-containing protein [Candidatus Xenobia bacterium]
MTTFELQSHPMPHFANGVVIRIRGELDMKIGGQFKDEFTSALGSTSHALIILDDVSFIDSHNLGIFVGAWQRLRGRDGWIGIVCSHPYVRRIFEVTNLDKLFRFYDSPQACADALMAEGLLPPGSSLSDLSFRPVAEPG